MLLTQKIYQSLTLINMDYIANLINVRPSTKQKFGDYQINGIIIAAKKANFSATDFAKKIVKSLNLIGIAKNIKIEQPGFINIFLEPKWITNQINQIFYLPNLGIISAKKQKTIIVDYSGPNVAKEMHVGHLRSTIIGDSIVRILIFLGHNVIRANHIGDWGTQFGMLIAYIKRTKSEHLFNKKKIKLSMLENFYQEAKKLYDSNSKFSKLSRYYTLKLQQRDKFCYQIWQSLVQITILNNQKIYNRLNVTLKKNDVIGESFYQNMLPKIIKDLKKKGLATISNGAVIVYLKNLYNKNEKPFGVIIQKNDGGYLYSSTDIACLKYRCKILKADKIIYYTDSRQKQHLTQIKQIANQAGYINQSMSVEHHFFGMLLEKTGKPFQTRSGNTLKLRKLLDEALIRAFHLIKTKKFHKKIKKNTINKLAHIISIGAIKYSELSKNRTIDYTFDWNHMLNFSGNTAPYIQYAYVRIFSILKKININNIKLNNDMQLNTKEEILLALHLLRFEEIINIVAKKGYPHILCEYLYKLSSFFSSFYEKCPVLNIKNKNIQCSRLKLACITAKTLKQGLNLLGIETTEEM